MASSNQSSLLHIQPSGPVKVTSIEGSLVLALMMHFNYSVRERFHWSAGKPSNNQCSFPCSLRFERDKGWSKMNRVCLETPGNVVACFLVTVVCTVGMYKPIFIITFFSWPMLIRYTDNFTFLYFNNEWIPCSLCTIEGKKVLLLCLFEDGKSTLIFSIGVCRCCAC